MQNKQIILVSETNKISQTDYFYINATIKKFYSLSNIKLTPLYMNGKTGYKDKKILNQIKSFTSMYKNTGITEVIYFIDLDCDGCNFAVGSRNRNIYDFCKLHNFDISYFSWDIEEVYLRKHVQSNDKLIEAKNFANNNMIDKININVLCTNSFKRYTSDILFVLDRHLSRKKQYA